MTNKQALKDKCPTCGSDVIVHSGDEGTGYFEPVEDNSDDGLVNDIRYLPRDYEIAPFDAERIIAKVRQHDKQSEWVSVGDETPKPETEVMVCVEDNTFWWGVYYESADQWYVRFGKDWVPSDCVTHWQHLPSSPGK